MFVDPSFAHDVRSYLQRTPRQLPSRYFYDELGPALFEAICRLPWYRITRSETALLDAHAAAVLAPLSRPIGLAELGCGSGEMLAIFATSAREPLSLVQLIDISPAALDMATYRLAAIGIRNVRTYLGTYEEGLRRASQDRHASGPLVVLFLGSNIGNFDPAGARELLVRIRTVLRPGDGLVLGTDLVKPERELLLAYDDPLGVTAAFNRNLLRRINDELGGNFALDGFSHRAVWNSSQRRVEAHLVSLRRQSVRVDAAHLDFTLQQDESIWTESSHKYEAAQVVEDGRLAGFGHAEQWIDREAGFALTRFTV